MLVSLFLVGLGGALGSIARYLVSLALTSPDPYAFPIATFLVNLLGSLVIGFVTGLLADGDHPRMMQFWSKGFCGGFTTFSTFSLETFGLFENGRYAMAGANVVVSLACCLVGVFAGMALGHYVKRAFA